MAVSCVQEEPSRIWTAQIRAGSAHECSLQVVQAPLTDPTVSKVSDVQTARRGRGQCNLFTLAQWMTSRVVNSYYCTLYSQRLWFWQLLRQLGYVMSVGRNKRWRARLLVSRVVSLERHSRLLCGFRRKLLPWALIMHFFSIFLVPFKEYFWYYFLLQTYIF